MVNFSLGFTDKLLASFYIFSFISIRLKVIERKIFDIKKFFLVPFLSIIVRLGVG